MKEKKISVNLIFSALKTLMGVLFPLITFPYATRILGPEYIGKIDYAFANVSYFALIGAFGISGYAVREGAKYRDSRKKISEFVGEMLAINLVTVVVAYSLCFASFFVPKWKPYRGIMLIFSSTIILTAVGLEWLYNIYEDYKYIAIRAVCFQILSLIILVTFVKSQKDYLIYVLTIITASVGSNILNVIRARKYIDYKIIFNNNFFRNIKPMFFLFIMNVASSIYLVMDKSMLGYITESDIEVGLYATAMKISTVITSIIASVRMVTTPRSAYYKKSNPKKSEEINYMSLELMFLFSIPCAIGMCLIGDSVILAFAGKEYTEAGGILKLLMLDVVFACVNGSLVNQFFVINQKDKKAASAVILGAITNLISNSIMIPYIGKTGAAISTCLSELVIMCFACIAGREVIKIEKMLPQIVQSIIASIPIVAIYLFVNNLGISDVLSVACTVCVGALFYFVVLFMLRNKYVVDAFNAIMKKRR